MENYFSIEYRHTGDPRLHRHGDCIVGQEGVLSIGQSPQCEVRISNPTPYEDAVFAIIRPDNLRRGWTLTPTARGRAEMRINGSPCHLIHYLRHGDRLSFLNLSDELVFHVVKDNGAAIGSRVIQVNSHHRRLQMALLTLLTLLVLVSGAAWLIGQHNSDALTDSMADAVKGSTFRLEVTAITRYDEANGSIFNAETITLDRTIGGTAFLTHDSLLITARHCIEPWLNDPQIEQPDGWRHLSNVATRWALEATTFNETTQGDTLKRVITTIDLFDSGGKLVRQIRSSDFSINTTRDLIKEMGDYENGYLWRSIAWRPGRSDMMLGDVAVMRIDTVGALQLADAAFLKENLSAEHAAYFFGYPSAEKSDLGIRMEKGNAKASTDTTKNPLISHTTMGMLSHGYSGGPVVIRDGGNVRVIGVISVLDAEGAKYSYSVPITELNNIKLDTRR